MFIHNDINNNDYNNNVNTTITTTDYNDNVIAAPITTTNCARYCVNSIDYEVNARVT